MPLLFFFGCEKDNDISEVNEPIVTHTVFVGNFYYDPPNITINQGEEIRWINDGGLHDVNGEINSLTNIPFDNPETFKGELSINEIEELTKNLGKSLLNVNLTGGEPFARKDIVEIAKLYLQNSTIQSIYVTTNASLPDRIKIFVEEISKFSPKTELGFQISIDDLPSSHNRVRKIKNLFDACMDTYKFLEKMSDNINPVVNTGPLTQGDTIPITSNGWGNPTFRCTKYPTNFSGFIGKDLTPGSFIELNPLSSSCEMISP